MSFALDIKQEEIIEKDVLERILRHGTDLGVSDFFIQSKRPIKARLHGKMELFTDFDVTRTHATQIAELIYGSVGVSSRLVSQGLSCSYDFRVKVSDSEHKDYRFRVNMMKGISGIMIVLRPLDAIPPKLSEIGMETDIRDALVSMMGHVSGNTLGKLFIIAGETGSGKSSSIACLIRYLIEESPLREDGLVGYTAEDPVEYLYSLVDDHTSVIEQFEMHKSFKTFPHAVREFMRMDPNFAVIGEIRDYETLSGVMQISNTGHVAISTIHANSITQIVTRMVDLLPSKESSVADIKQLLELMGVAIFQKLVPRKKKDLSQKKGGRVAIREYLIFTEEVREYLANNLDNLSKATQYCVEKFGRSYAQHTQELVREGVIDV